MYRSPWIQSKELKVFYSVSRVVSRVLYEYNLKNWKLSVSLIISSLLSTRIQSKELKATTAGGSSITYTLGTGIQSKELKAKTTLTEILSHVFWNTVKEYNLKNWKSLLIASNTLSCSGEYNLKNWKTAVCSLASIGLPVIGSYTEYNLKNWKIWGKRPCNTVEVEWENTI